MTLVTDECTDLSSSPVCTKADHVTFQLRWMSANQKSIGNCTQEAQSAVESERSENVLLHNHRHLQSAFSPSSAQHQYFIPYWKQHNMITNIVYIVKPDITATTTLTINESCVYLASSYCFTVIKVSSIVLKHNVLRVLVKNVTAAVNHTCMSVSKHTHSLAM